MLLLDHPRTYRIAPELRRSAIYAMIGFAFTAAAAFWIGHVLLERELEATLAMCSMFAAISLSMIVPLRWALYVDESGIARRWLFGWDLWAWSDFASGRIEKHHPIRFVDPDRPWWRRTLNIGHVAEAEQKELIRLINQHYHLPPPAALPETLEIGYGFRRKVEFQRRAIQLTVSGETFHFIWRDVQQLHITRTDPLRRDFVSLEIALPGHQGDGLPGHEIEMKVRSSESGTSTSWKGATAEVLCEFLLAHVPANCVCIDIDGERPVRMEDVQKQLDRARVNERGFRIMMWVFAGLFAGLSVWMVIDVGFRRALAVAASYSLMVPVIWGFHREVRKNTKRLEAWLADFAMEPRGFGQRKR